MTTLSRAVPDMLADPLRAEYAAIYGYGVVNAHLRKSLRTAGRRIEEIHRSRRDALLSRLAAASTPPPKAEPAYVVPFRVTDSTSAVRLAIQLEERTAAVWRAALGVARGKDRRLALDALIDSAVEASRWRVAAKQTATVPFPGATRS